MLRRINPNRGDPELRVPFRDPAERDASENGRASGALLMPGPLQAIFQRLDTFVGVPLGTALLVSMTAVVQTSFGRMARVVGNPPCVEFSSECAKKIANVALNIDHHWDGLIGVLYPPMLIIS
jgi:hypothetical protein